MADVSMYKDKKKWDAFVSEGKAAFKRIKDEIAGQEGVVAVEPASGDYFVGATLGKANDLAFEKYPDQWIYFVRLDDPEAAMPLPTW